ncbi:GTPase IMAP family member 4,GTPase IMAP family member 7 [Mytilus coruscus]|uniref:GTPase IMAP family member 4,GTPase IMAP family member 7 n=1 Tax=Mytilus coruscus TaxID=42192 RepID=A0A6J8BA01_MYTCO|nr:GTPase IMAP family member 4,GTPase IMAP family member 7 [Mytilus coruscus]
MAEQTSLNPFKRPISPDLQRQDDQNKVQRITGQLEDLDEEKKRWLIVGICLHSIISPLLRRYIDPIVSNLYNSLKSSDSIDKQENNKYLKKYPATNTYYLNYESINNNRNEKRNYWNYDYKVTSHVDLSKLFLLPNMANYSGIDESCDSSALLGMIIRISSFPPGVKIVAEKIRENIRNSWAHCKFGEWDRVKYTNSFVLMGQLVKELDLGDSERNRIFGELKTWSTNGLKFMKKKTLGLEIVDEIRQHTHVLSEYVQTRLTETDNQFHSVHKELKDLESGLQERIENLESKTKEQDDIIKNLKKEVREKKVEDHNPKHIPDSPVSAKDNEIRIVLIGRTGHGKSATGNSLLGDIHFQSQMSTTSVTEKCKRGEFKRKGKKVVIVDTPGLFDTETTNETVTKEIIKCIGMTSPGPHVMVLVVSLGRFTREEQETVKHFVNLFGENVFRHMIVVFTRKDELSKSNLSIEQYVETSQNDLKTILGKCENRFIAFFNDAVGQSKFEQVDGFFEIVESMRIKNGGACYTNELYKEAELALQGRMRIEKEALEMKMKKETEAVRNEVQDKYKKKLEKELKAKSKLEDVLNSNKIKSEKDKENLQKQLDEANEKLNRELEKKEKEILEQIRKTEDEFKPKMTENALRTNQRNNVENERGGILSDILEGLVSFAKLFGL